jgi:hypothetical protein
LNSFRYQQAETLSRSGHGAPTFMIVLNTIEWKPTLTRKGQRPKYLSGLVTRFFWGAYFVFMFQNSQEIRFAAGLFTRS